MIPISTMVVKLTWSRIDPRNSSIVARVYQRGPSAYAHRRVRRTSSGKRSVAIAHSPAASDMQLGHFLSMCDDTGLFQHAVHSVPDRAHGYCVDDNARALILTVLLQELGEEEAAARALGTTYLAFVNYSFDRATRKFRNFMSFDRVWLEDEGSDDSFGRSV